MYNYLFNEEIIKQNHDYQLLNQGRNEGISIGEVRGRNAGIMFSAVNMLKNGIDSAMVAQCTGLSIDEVNTLSM